MSEVEDQAVLRASTYNLSGPILIRTSEQDEGLGYRCLVSHIDFPQAIMSGRDLFFVESTTIQIFVEDWHKAKRTETDFADLSISSELTEYLNRRIKDIYISKLRATPTPRSASLSSIVISSARQAVEFKFSAYSPREMEARMKGHRPGLEQVELPRFTSAASVKLGAPKRQEREWTFDVNVPTSVDYAGKELVLSSEMLNHHCNATTAGISVKLKQCVAKGSNRASTQRSVSDIQVDEWQRYALLVEFAKGVVQVKVEDNAQFEDGSATRQDIIDLPGNEVVTKVTINYSLLSA